MEDEVILCPSCKRGGLFRVKESNGVIKEVCENHADAVVYGVNGKRNCVYMRVIDDGNDKTCTKTLNGLV